MILKKTALVLSVLAPLAGFAFWLDTRYVKSEDLQAVKKKIDVSSRVLEHIRIDQLRHEGREIKKEAQAEKRNITGPEQRRLDDINIEIERLKQ